MSNVVIARLYQDHNLIGVFPRTTAGRNSLDELLSLTNSDGRLIQEESVHAYLKRSGDGSAFLPTLLSKTKGDLTLSTHSIDHAGVLVALETGNFAEDYIKTAQDLLEKGAVRTAEKIYDPQTSKGNWVPQKHGFLCMNSMFKRENKVMGLGFYDKVPLLSTDWTEEYFAKRGVRFVPGSVVRAGAYIGKGTVIMGPVLVNTGAYIAGDQTMIDGGARVTSAAQLGNRVKLGGGSSMEGVLEPPGAMPTIIEDGVRIGAQCEVCGIIEEGAGIGSGVVMSKEKKIYDMRTKDFQPRRRIEVEGKEYGIPYIPAHRIAVPGTYHKEGHGISLACTVLLEKDAEDSSFTQAEKNQDLYVKV